MESGYTGIANYKGSMEGCHLINALDKFYTNKVTKAKEQDRARIV